MSHNILPTYFLSHGGGPWPYMDGPFRAMFANLEASLRGLLHGWDDLPTAVLIVTGHWEEREFTVSSNPRPSMLYDYGGFPPHTYQVRYAAPGSSTLAARIDDMLTSGGIPCRIDTARGFDHGTFTLMEPIRPEADIPVVQMSLKSGFDPSEHLAMGRLLAPLRGEGVLIIGSGMSYHNLSLMDDRAREPSARFDDWLQEALVGRSGEARAEQLAKWHRAPCARLVHPREDHLLPLMVAAGAAWDDPGACIFRDEHLFGSITASSFRFGAYQSATNREIPHVDVQANTLRP